MKKNILFIIPSLNVGGGEKSLVSLLNQMNYSKYNVDLFLIKKKGLFLKMIPNEVNIVSTPESLKIFSKGLAESIKEYLKMMDLKLVYSRIMFALVNRFCKDKIKSEQKSWKYMSKGIGKLDKKYDVAIGFLEKTSNYLCVDNVTADKKIGWIHTNYENMGMSAKFDKRYFKSLDFIVSISEECVEVLKKNFNMYNDKFKLMYNIVSPKFIQELAKEDVTDIEIKKNVINIISVGRLSFEKGIDLSIKACKLLIDNGFNIHWIVVGEGNERNNLEQLISYYKLEKYFQLIGAKENPYKYIQLSDIYVQASRFEGKSIAIDEAKILAKPIVVTNFDTAKDQIENMINGLIVETNENAIYEGVKRIIEDFELRKNLKSNLDNCQLGTESEIYKLYELIEGNN